jgi:Fic-DOC domain mobile mystery protein B
VERAVTDIFQTPDDATPLAPEERDALLQTWIASRDDLNEAEQENIVKGASWARRRSRKPADLLTESFAKSLHQHMLGEVWKWAGSYRLTERNIGIEAFRIPVEMPVTLDDARYWVGHATFPADEIALRFHHRLTAIHPFPNGNGRHARLMADLLVERLGRQAFTWGGGLLVDVGELRTRYVNALKAADGHDIGPLLAFARS